MDLEAELKPSMSAARARTSLLFRTCGIRGAGARDAEQAAAHGAEVSQARCKCVISIVHMRRAGGRIMPDSSQPERVDGNAELVRQDLGKAAQQLEREPGKGL